MGELVRIGMYEYTAQLQENLGGPQVIFHFDNGYGASVIQNQLSYGGNEGFWELAVLKFAKDGEWNLCYDTDITHNVIGWQSPEEIDELLKRIQAL